MNDKTVLMATIGSAGDVHPAIAIAQGLGAQGQRAVLVANPQFQAVAEDAGVAFIPLGTAEGYEALVANPDMWHPVRGFQALVEALIVPHIKPVYEIIARFDPRSTLLVASGLLFGARMAHEKLGMRYVTLHLQPALFRSLYDTPITGGVAIPERTPKWLKRLYFRLIDRFVVERLLGPPVNRIRQEMGLPAQRDFFGEQMHALQKTMGLFPGWFAPPQPDWPSQTELTGFVRYDRGEAGTLAAEVAAFLAAGDPPLVFTAGTGMLHAQKFFETSARAAQLLNRRALLLTLYEEQVPAALPPGIRHFAYVPFSLLLPHAAALVHHGGIGTLAQGLAAGVPQLVMPMSHDQLDNARRLERLGVGATVYPRQYTAQRVAQTLDRLLGSPTARERCQSLASCVDFAGSLQATCGAIAGQLAMI